MTEDTRPTRAEFLEMAPLHRQSLVALKDVNGNPITKQQAIAMRRARRAKRSQNVREITLSDIPKREVKSEGVPDAGR